MRGLIRTLGNLLRREPLPELPWTAWDWFALVMIGQVVFLVLAFLAP